MFIPNYFTRQTSSTIRPKGKRKSAKPQTRRRLFMEILEDRRVLALVGVAPIDFPNFNYNFDGTVEYSSTTNLFHLNATPLQFADIPADPDFSFFFSGDIDLRLQTDALGNLVGGVPLDDLVITGDVDVNGDFVVDYSGVLLTGEITEFGWLDSGSGTDFYDFRFTITGGAMASLYAGRDLGITTTSESSTFTGDFGANFSGDAKGLVGAIDKEEQLARLSGIKYSDQTGNGISGDDSPLAGVTINLYQDTGVIGVLDGESVFQFDITDVNGEYSFENLTPGNYIVEEVVPGGYTPTTPTTLTVTLAAGEDISTGFDFANLELARLSGVKYSDQTGDGISGDDSPLDLVTINLYQDFGTIGEFDGADVLHASDVTDVNGEYSFEDLLPGNYIVQEIVPAGYLPTSPTELAVAIAAGDNITTGFDFANFLLGSLSGKKFNDVDGDGTDDGGLDPGLAGWTIELDKDANGTVDATTVTGPGGVYSFTGLVAGVYRVREVGQVGWIQTTVNPGDVSVVSGTNSTDNNFGNFQLGSLSGKKFEDVDGDGTDDGGLDPGLAGWTIELDKDADGTVDATTVTGPGGVYSFTGLVASVYRVRELGQAGWIQTTVNPGDVSIVSGTNSSGNNFGNRQRVPGIDLEKTTNGPTNSNPTAPDYNNEDSENGPGVPILTPGSTVTWTYKVTNTGELDYAFNEVVIVDDNGTPGNTADDMSTTGGQITFQSVQVGDADNILEPGEVWIYEASDTVQNVGSSGPAVTFNFSGSSALDGTDGNIRTFTSGGVSVKASAFSRDSSGVWQTAYLGSYGGGLGVTDRSEGSGSGNAHTVDNTGRDNYVLFELSESVVVDSTFLGYVVGDSDLRIWIGTLTDPFNNHVTLSDALLSGMFTEVNETTLSSARLADLNAGGLSGNVLIIAANTGEPTTDDNFKIEKLTVKGHDCYENKAVVTVPGATDFDFSHYCTAAIPPDPGIDIEKYTNGIDADTAADAPEIAPGETVTWTYKVTNTGNVAFTSSQVVVRDDNGTPGSSGDDFTPTRVLSSDVGGDGILSPGEVWMYTASATAMDLMTPGTEHTIDFSGNSSTDGTDGNTRTFSAGGVSVKTSAFSRDKSSGVWSSAYLGSYSGGLGVTDSSEGSGSSSSSHTVDNSGRDNYVLFEFSQSVVVDSAFLGYVVGDSDLTVWIGSMADPFNNHVTLSDSVLSSLGFTEVNLGGSSSRTADFNASQFAGNVLVVAAKTGESNDYFKIEKLCFEKLELGIYKNTGEVTAGSVSDTDASHYKNPECVGVTFAFAGNSSTTGTKGNIRTYTTGGVSVNASAFSRTTNGYWNTAYLGAYSEGLGVTDTSENGSNGTHRTDNVGQMNFVLFEFSTLVEIDRAFLDSVVTDSDVSIWIGTTNNPFHNHLTLSDSLAGMMSYYETNNTDSSGDRWAEFNSGNMVGNVLIIAASVEDTTPDDQFKISKLDVCAKSVKFYTVDPSADDTFEYGPSGQALANYNLDASNTNARGVASTSSGNMVWVVDGNKKVYRYDTNGVLQGSWTANGLTTPEDITTNGNDVWIVDNGLNKVFKYSGGSGNGANRTSGSQNAASSFSLNSANGDAKGIVTDGTNIWVVNDAASGADKVFKYTMSGTLVGSWTIDSNNGSPTGITIDPTNINHLWIVDSADDAVYRYNGATGRTSGSQAADSVFQLAGGNGDAQGIADPPPGNDLATHAVDGQSSGRLRSAWNGVKDMAFAAWSNTPATQSRFVARATNMLVNPLNRFADAIYGNSQLASNYQDAAPALKSLALQNKFATDVELDEMFECLAENYVAHNFV